MNAIHEPLLLKLARFIRRLAIGLMPLAIGLWYYLPVASLERPRIYFTYTSALLYVSDVLAIVAVAAGALFFTTRAVKASAILRNHPALAITYHSSPPLPKMTLLDGLLAALALLATASLLWSADQALSLAAVLHIWLMFALYLTVRSDPQSWRWFAWGCVAALLLQSLVAIAEFAFQTTALLEPLRLNWPGSLVPEIRGASVVQTASGARWLRAYGTLPHPNIAGGLLVALIAGLSALFLSGGRRRWWAALLAGLGTIALVLTFSRSAWVGLAAAALVIALRWRSFERRRLLALAVVMGCAGLLAVWPTSELIFTRLSAAPDVPTERMSTLQRLALMDLSLETIRTHPLLGVGIGASLADQATTVGGDYPIEPVHNVPLLATSELGLLGGVLWLALIAGLLFALRRSRTPQAVIFVAAALALLAISLFDHYLWTLPPTRLLLWLVLGLVAAS